MIRPVLGGLLASVFCTFFQPGPALADEDNADTLIYLNGRFGFKVMMPGDYVISPPPGNNDGRTFKGYDGKVELLAYASRLNEDFASARTDTLAFLKKNGAQITYEDKGATWFVVSGYDSKGSIFYERVIKTEDCFGEAIAATVSITYPPDTREQVEPYLSFIAQSLKGCDTLD